MTTEKMLKIARHGKQVRVFKTQAAYDKCVARKGGEKPLAETFDEQTGVRKVVWKSDEWGYLKGKI